MSIPPPIVVLFPDDLADTPLDTEVSWSPARKPMALTPSSSRVSSGSMESVMATRVLDMSTSPTTVLLPMSLIILEKEVSPSPSVDSDSLLAAPRDDRKSVVSTASCGCRKSADRKSVV